MNPSAALIAPEEGEIIIFTDGSSRGNPGPGGFAAVALYPDAHGVMQVDEIGGREALTTNNRMELRAVIEGIKNFEGYYSDLSEYSFSFYIDSAYVVNGATKWMAGWKRNGWITGAKEEVKNRDLWEELSSLIGSKEGKLRIRWNLIEGHAGIAGNERCDVIATAFADDKPIKLYAGSLAGHLESSGANILDIHAVDQAKKDQMKSRKKSSGSSSGKKAYSYVSSIAGDVQKHSTWAECEARVKGKNARFKKSFSKEDEDAIAREFSR